jgi:hypothetical protein
MPLPHFGRISIIDITILSLISIGIYNLNYKCLVPELKLARRLFIISVIAVIYAIIVGLLNGANLYYLALDTRLALGFLAGIAIYTCTYRGDVEFHYVLSIFGACALVIALFLIYYKVSDIISLETSFYYRAADSSIMTAYGPGCVLVPMLLYYCLCTRGLLGMIGVSLVLCAITSISIFAAIRSFAIVGSFGVILVVYTVIIAKKPAMQECRIGDAGLKLRAAGVSVIVGLLLLSVTALQKTDYHMFYEKSMNRWEELKYVKYGPRYLELFELISQHRGIDYLFGKGFGGTYKTTVIGKGGDALIPHISAFIFLLKFGILGQILFFWYLIKSGSKFVLLVLKHDSRISSAYIAEITLFVYLCGSLLSGIFSPMINVFLGYLAADFFGKGRLADAK